MSIEGRRANFEFNDEDDPFYKENAIGALAHARYDELKKERPWGRRCQ